MHIFVSDTGIFPYLSYNAKQFDVIYYLRFIMQMLLFHTTVAFSYNRA